MCKTNDCKMCKVMDIVQESTRVELEEILDIVQSEIRSSEMAIKEGFEESDEECYCGDRGKCSVCVEGSVDIGDLLKDQRKDILKMGMVKGVVR